VNLIRFIRNMQPFEIWAKTEILSCLPCRFGCRFGFVWIGWFMFLFLISNFLVFGIILFQIHKLKFIFNILKFEF
jgi:hypothetical protein